ncbi:hypothetical protein ECC18A13_p11160 (plasmid) [Enterobacter sp. 18A13]|uniref:response regulator n=2 Tax=Enterobacteriaceae TaxID=543 RepID=UPI0010CA3ACC|nr:response regulator [Enterobacter asburiae]UKU10092.1 kinase [Enterobacter asburiae]BBJ69874.1 hypothetical protein ECC18A13_p11160 [Enterobacter sp. 18A13]
MLSPCEVKIPSFGMGLAIVDGLVKALKGEIEVKSEEGIGSELIVKLPVIVEQSVDLQNTSLKQIDYPVPANLNIIVIDDNELSCFTIAEMLSTYDHICETSTSPTRALEKLARKPYDIILCDLQMPVITGDQLLKHIRDNEGPNMRTPFVFISAYAEKFKVMNTKVISKPVHSEELLSVISKAIIK